MHHYDLKITYFGSHGLGSDRGLPTGSLIMVKLGDLELGYLGALAIWRDSNERRDL